LYKFAHVDIIMCHVGRCTTLPDTTQHAPSGRDLFGSRKIKIDVCIVECQLSELIGTKEV